MHAKRPITWEPPRARGPGERLRFGEFELQIETGELLRDGRRVPLQPQPAQVLRVLAESAGTVVSRTRLQQALWGADVEVDADQGLNYCILQIRRALDDDAERPRFVETIPRRGYRFLPLVEVATRRAEGGVPAASGSWRAWLVGAASSMLLLAAAAWLASTGKGAASRPLLTVSPLRGDELSQGAAAALTDELLSQIVARYGERLAVVEGVETEAGEGEARRKPSHFLVGGTVLPAGEGLRSTVWLERLPDRLRLWSATYELLDEPAGRARCARRVVDDLADRLGLEAAAPTTR